MGRQNTSTILMIRPVAFEFNAQTAEDNHYQVNTDGMSSETSQTLALKEFDAFVTTLREADVEVIVVDDTLDPKTPDSIFPNNWVSFHDEGTVVLYPMHAPNRRHERRMDVLETLREAGFRIDRLLDLSNSEADGRFLEGTGSLVLDREHHIAYVCLSQRSDPALLSQWAREMGYRAVSFRALQHFEGALLPIYHTNVMMCVGSELAVVCVDSVKDPNERKQLIKVLANTGKELLLITEDQKSNFAGNMLQLVSRKGERLMIMSTRAFNSLTSAQIGMIEKTNRIIHSSLTTIETLGGGSARCMMAEVFLPRK